MEAKLRDVKEGPSPEGGTQGPGPTNHRGEPAASGSTSKTMVAGMEDLVQRVKFELMAFKGCALTATLRGLIGPTIWLEAPKLSVKAIMGALSVDGVRGAIIDEELAEGRARAIARLAVPR